MKLPRWWKVSLVIFFLIEIPKHQKQATNILSQEFMEVDQRAFSQVRQRDHHRIQTMLVLSKAKVFSRTVQSSNSERSDLRFDAWKPFLSKEIWESVCVISRERDFKTGFYGAQHNRVPRRICTQDCTYTFFHLFVQYWMCSILAILPQLSCTHRDTYLEQQQTENIENEVRDVDRTRITKVYDCCSGWPFGWS